jgi:hypothetical protein
MKSCGIWHTARNEARTANMTLRQGAAAPHSLGRSVNLLAFGKLIADLHVTGVADHGDRHVFRW